MSGGAGFLPSTVPQLVYSLLVNHASKYSYPKNVKWCPVCQDFETSQMICDLYDLESWKKKSFDTVDASEIPFPTTERMVLKPCK